MVKGNEPGDEKLPTMLNTFASLQHISQFDFQAAWEILSDNLRLYPESYGSKEAFVNSADEICNQFGEDQRLTKEDNEAIAAKVWEEQLPAMSTQTLPANIADFSHEDFKALARQLSSEARWINDTHRVKWDLDRDVCLTIVVGNNNDIYRIADNDDNILWSLDTKEEELTEA